MLLVAVRGAQASLVCHTAGEHRRCCQTEWPNRDTTVGGGGQRSCAALEDGEDEEGGASQGV